jgi:adenine-specific DNA-methyltransferase
MFDKLLVTIIRNSPASKTCVSIYGALDFAKAPREKRHYNQSEFIQADYYIGIFERKEDKEILHKIDTLSQPLQQVARPCSGYNPYEVGKGLAPQGGPHTKDTVKTKPYHSTQQLGPEWKPEIRGRDLGRYCLKITRKRWVKYGPWLSAPRDPANFVGPRILVREITGGKDRRIVATYYDRELYHSRDVIPIKVEHALPHPFYLLGLINSQLLTWYHHKRNPKAQKQLFPKVLVSDLRELPVFRIDFNDPAHVLHHDKMVSLVERMLNLHREMLSASADRKADLEQQIAGTDGEIDALVYELYGLTEEEIAIVEGR